MVSKEQFSFGLLPHLVIIYKNNLVAIQGSHSDIGMIQSTKALRKSVRKQFFEFWWKKNGFWGRGGHSYEMFGEGGTSRREFRGRHWRRQRQSRLSVGISFNLIRVNFFLNIR